MKQFVRIFVVVLLLISLTACGEYTQGILGSRPTYTEPSKPAVVGEEGTFSVTLTMNGQPYVPDIEIYAQWTDGYSYHTAKFNENGVAAVGGLDGDYKVTLTAVPEDYGYNINGYVATNADPDITIDLYRILYGNGPGTDLYAGVKELNVCGAYQVTINGPDDVVYCRFAPQEAGIYTIESWMSVAEDNVNPKADMFYGSVAAVWPQGTLDDGGAESESGYVKNFKFTRQITEDEIGNVFVFGVRATVKNNEYPVTVTFAVTKVGMPIDKQEKTWVVPQETIRQAKNHKGFIPAQKDTGTGISVQDSSLYKYWPVEEGGDGFYHVYDEEKYAKFGGYGPTLYATIAAPCQNLPATDMQGDTQVQFFLQLSTIEYQGNGNNMLTVKIDGRYYSYKHFIEGYESVALYRSFWGGSAYCVGDCKCKHKPSNVIGCKLGCTKCDPRCLQVKPELYGAPGYADGCNSDGRYPVTQELKEFLQLFSICQALFVDGTGSVEMNGVASDEESQWLFACGYYSDDKGGKCEMGKEIPNFYG